MKMLELKIEDLQNSSLFYNLANFDSNLQTAIQNRGEIIAKIASVEKWEKEFQQAKFVAFVSK